STRRSGLTPFAHVLLVAVCVLLATVGALAVAGPARAMAETGAIVVGGEPKYVLSDPVDGLLYVSDFAGEEVAVADVATGLVVRRLPVPGGPVGLALSADGGLYVASYFGNSLVLLDPQTGRTRLVRAGVEAPWDVKMVWGPAGRSLVAVTEHHGDSVTFFDPLTLAKVGRVPTGDYPYQMDVDEGAGILYVGVYGGWDGGEVTAIDLRTLKELWTVGAGRGSFDVAVDPVAGRLLVTDFVGSTLTQVAVAGTGVRHDQISGKPKAGLFAPGGAEAWVALQTTDQVVRVDPARAAVTQTIPVGSLPGPMTWVAGASELTLAVGNQGDGTISLLTNGPPVPEFTDVSPSHPLHREIRTLALRGAIGGYDLGDGTFAYRPNSTLMRAQIAKILVGSLALHTPQIEDAGAAAFVDVPAGTGEYPYDYVQEASRLGLVNGFATSPPVFKPYVPVTRIQLLRMAVRAASAMGSSLSVPAGGSPFYDVGPADPDLDIIKAAYAAGLVSGTTGPDGRVRLRPYDDAGRGETAHVVFALLAALHRGGPQ
ncbi:MAG: S-layer homology domain-containing protein, partial [Thermoleophilia bacterium]